MVLCDYIFFDDSYHCLYREQVVIDVYFCIFIHLDMLYDIKALSANYKIVYD